MDTGYGGDMPRYSTKLGMKAAQTLYYAEEQAQRIGYPLTLSITINFSLLGIGPAGASEAFRTLRSGRFAPWIRRPPKSSKHQGVPPTYSYGFENSLNGRAYLDPDGPHNVHAHWAVHVPAAREHDFRNRLHDWVDAMAGNNEWPSHALEIRSITSPGKVARYPIKGASQAVATHFGVKKRDIAAQGIIIGQRTGTTRNIGPEARRKRDKEMGIRRQIYRPL